MVLSKLDQWAVVAFINQNFTQKNLFLCRIFGCSCVYFILSSRDIFYLAFMVLLHLPPTGGHCLINIAKLGLFYLINIIFILLLN